MHLKLLRVWVRLLLLLRKRHKVAVLAVFVLRDWVVVEERGRSHGL